MKRNRFDGVNEYFDPLSEYFRPSKRANHGDYLTVTNNGDQLDWVPAVTQDQIDILTNTKLDKPSNVGGFVVTSTSDGYQESIISETELNTLDGVTSNIQNQFNSKLDVPSYIGSRVALTSTNGFTESSITSTQLGYLSGVTSAIQTQLNSKFNTPSFTGSRVPLTTTNGFSESSITNTQLGYLSGVTSAIQTQLNSKFNTPSYTGSKVPVTTSNGFNESAVTSTELGYLSGTTSSIQTQINSKFNTPAYTGAKVPVTTSNGFTESSVTSTELGHLSGVTAPLQPQINVKYNIPVFTGSRVALTAPSGFTESTITNTQLGYLSGVTSAIQSQINTKFGIPTFTGSRVPITSTNGFTESSVTNTELSYLSGVTSSIQSQINALGPSILGNNNIFTGNNVFNSELRTTTGPIYTSTNSGGGFPGTKKLVIYDANDPTRVYNWSGFSYSTSQFNNHVVNTNSFVWHVGAANDLSSTELMRLNSSGLTTSVPFTGTTGTFNVGSGSRTVGIGTPSNMSGIFCNGSSTRRADFKCDTNGDIHISSGPDTFLKYEYASGGISLLNGGTNPTSGYKLDITGKTRVNGDFVATGSVSGTNILSIDNRVTALENGRSIAQQWTMKDDFDGAVLNTNKWFTSFTSGASATNVQEALTAKGMCSLVCDIGTYSSISFLTGVTMNRDWVLTARVRVPTSSAHSDASNIFRYYIGVTEANWLTDSLYNFGLYMTNNNGSWKLNSGTSFTTGTNTGNATVALGTWVVLRMEYNATTRDCAYFADGVLAGTISANTQSLTDNFRIRIGIIKQISNRSHQIDVDYITVSQPFPR